MILLKRILKVNNKDGNYLIPVMLIIAGTVFLMIGVYRGEMAVVLRKAVNICLECIGIG